MSEYHGLTPNDRVFSIISRLSSIVALIATVLSVTLLWLRPLVWQNKKVLLMTNLVISNGLGEIVRLCYHTVRASANGFMRPAVCFSLTTHLTWTSFLLPAAFVVLMVDTGLEMTFPRFYTLKVTPKAVLAQIFVAQLINVALLFPVYNDYLDIFSPTNIIWTICDAGKLVPMSPVCLIYNGAMLFLMVLIGTEHWIVSIYGALAERSGHSTNIGRTEQFPSKAVMFAMMIGGSFMFVVILLTALAPLLKLGDTTAFYFASTLEILRAGFVSLQFYICPPIFQALCELFHRSSSSNSFKQPKYPHQ